MATRRAAALAVGGAGAILSSAGGSHEAECDATSSLASSFDVISTMDISDAELDQVTAELVKEAAASGRTADATGSTHSIKSLGNGWISAEDGSPAVAALSLGRELAGDPRVQAAVMERVRDPASLAAPAKLLEELKLVLVSRDVVADGEHTTDSSPRMTTPPPLSRQESVQTAEPEDEQHAPSKDAPPADAGERPGLGAVLLEAALVVASVIIVTVVARRVNAKAVSIAASALAGAWGYLWGGRK